MTRDYLLIYYCTCLCFSFSMQATIPSESLKVALHKENESGTPLHFKIRRVGLSSIENAHLSTIEKEEVSGKNPETSTKNKFDRHSENIDLVSPDFRYRWRKPNFRSRWPKGRDFLPRNQLIFFPRMRKKIPDSSKENAENDRLKAFFVFRNEKSKSDLIRNDFSERSKPAKLMKPNPSAYWQQKSNLRTAEFPKIIWRPIHRIMENIPLSSGQSKSHSWIPPLMIPATRHRRRMSSLDLNAQTRHPNRWQGMHLQFVFAKRPKRNKRPIWEKGIQASHLEETRLRNKVRKVQVSMLNNVQAFGRNHLKLDSWNSVALRKRIKDGDGIWKSSSISFHQKWKRRKSLNEQHGKKINYSKFIDTHFRINRGLYTYKDVAAGKLLARIYSQTLKRRGGPTESFMRFHWPTTSMIQKRKLMKLRTWKRFLEHMIKSRIAIDTIYGPVHFTKFHKPGMMIKNRFRTANAPDIKVKKTHLPVPLKRLMNRKMYELKTAKNVYNHQTGTLIYRGLLKLIQLLKRFRKQINLRVHNKNNKDTAKTFVSKEKITMGKPSARSSFGVDLENKLVSNKDKKEESNHIKDKTSLHTARSKFRAEKHPVETTQSIVSTENPQQNDKTSVATRRVSPKKQHRVKYFSIMSKRTKPSVTTTTESIVHKHDDNRYFPYFGTLWQRVASPINHVTTFVTKELKQIPREIAEVAHDWQKRIKSTLVDKFDFLGNFSFSNDSCGSKCGQENLIPLTSKPARILTVSKPSTERFRNHGQYEMNQMSYTTKRLNEPQGHPSMSLSPQDSSQKNKNLLHWLSYLSKIEENTNATTDSWNKTEKETKDKNQIDGNTLKFVEFGVEMQKERNRVPLREGNDMKATNLVRFTSRKLLGVDEHSESPSTEAVSSQNRKFHRRKMLPKATFESPLSKHRKTYSDNGNGVYVAPGVKAQHIDYDSQYFRNDPENKNSLYRIQKRQSRLFPIASFPDDKRKRDKHGFWKHEAPLENHETDLDDTEGQKPIPLKESLRANDNHNIQAHSIHSQLNNVADSQSRFENAHRKDNYQPSADSNIQGINDKLSQEIPHRFTESDFHAQRYPGRKWEHTHATDADIKLLKNIEMLIHLVLDNKIRPEKDQENRSNEEDDNAWTKTNRKNLRNTLGQVLDTAIREPKHETNYAVSSTKHLGNNDMKPHSRLRRDVFSAAKDDPLSFVAKWREQRREALKLLSDAHSATESLRESENKLERMIEKGNLLSKQVEKLSSEDHTNEAMKKANWEAAKKEFEKFKKYIKRQREMVEKKEIAALEDSMRRKVKKIDKAITSQQSYLDGVFDGQIRTEQAIPFSVISNRRDQNLFKEQLRGVKDVYSGNAITSFDANADPDQGSLEKELEYLVRNRDKLLGETVHTDADLEEVDDKLREIISRNTRSAKSAYDSDDPAQGDLELDVRRGITSKPEREAVSLSKRSADPCVNAEAERWKTERSKILTMLEKAVREKEDEIPLNENNFMEANKKRKKREGWDAFEFDNGNSIASDTKAALGGSQDGQKQKETNLKQNSLNKIEHDDAEEIPNEMKTTFPEDGYEGEKHGTKSELEKSDNITEDEAKTKESKAGKDIKKKDDAKKLDGIDTKKNEKLDEGWKQGRLQSHKLLSDDVIMNEIKKLRLKLARIPRLFSKNDIEEQVQDAHEDMKRTWSDQELAIPNLDFNTDPYDSILTKDLQKQNGRGNSYQRKLDQRVGAQSDRTLRMWDEPLKEFSTKKPFSSKNIAIQDKEVVKKNRNVGGVLDDRGDRLMDETNLDREQCEKFSRFSDIEDKNEIDEDDLFGLRASEQYDIKNLVFLKEAKEKLDKLKMEQEKELKEIEKERNMKRKEDEKVKKVLETNMKAMVKEAVKQIKHDQENMNDAIKARNKQMEVNRKFMTKELQALQRMDMDAFNLDNIQKKLEK